MAHREKDYVSRQIAALARILARVIGLKEAGRPEEARLDIARSAGTVLGLEYGTLERLDASSAVELLRERERIDAYAQLLEMEAGLLDDGPQEPDRSRASWLRERASAVRAAGAALGRG